MINSTRNMWVYIGGIVGLLTVSVGGTATLYEKFSGIEKNVDAIRVSNSSAQAEQGRQFAIRMNEMHDLVVSNKAESQRQIDGLTAAMKVMNAGQSKPRDRELVHELMDTKGMPESRRPTAAEMKK
jgi:hypothetical protein